jgi:hypothetical protein
MISHPLQNTTTIGKCLSLRLLFPKTQNQTRYLNVVNQLRWCGGACLHYAFGHRRKNQPMSQRLERVFKLLEPRNMPATMLGNIKTPLLIPFRLLSLHRLQKLKWYSIMLQHILCVFVAQRCEAWADGRCFRAVHHFPFPRGACDRVYSVQRLTLLRQ